MNGENSILNNAINHGIFSPLGIQQSEEMGPLDLLLIGENKPGPGLSLLLTWYLIQGSAKRNLLRIASIIHF
ncbi:hypothetical protein OH492_13665 [Vibrio chagasii]|nr:hypothetical protein [Vibrio chagasii]